MRGVRGRAAEAGQGAALGFLCHFPGPAGGGHVEPAVDVSAVLRGALKVHLVRFVEAFNKSRLNLFFREKCRGAAATPASKTLRRATPACSSRAEARRR